MGEKNCPTQNNSSCHVRMMHVVVKCRTLFDECLTGFLKGKTIILCANQLQFLSQTDLVLVVHQGKIVEVRWMLQGDLHVQWKRQFF